MSFPGFIGKQHGMTQVFDEEGNAHAVTVLELMPLTVTQVKTQENDGYVAIQVGYQDAKAKHLSKAEQGHFQKNDLELKRHLQEFRVAEATLSAGDLVDPFADDSFLQPGTKISVTSQSIGKGTQGGTKRWGFARGPMSHGSKSHRIPGSIGPGTTPGRVYKGKKMAGRMGAKQITIKNLTVFKVLPEQRLVLIRGTVPGVEGTYVTLKK